MGTGFGVSNRLPAPRQAPALLSPSPCTQRPDADRDVRFTVLKRGTMSTPEQSSAATLFAELNDLLQLDRDAVQAYTLAEKALQSDAHRVAIVRFRGDHERHIDELTRLITARGGTPAALPHLSSSPFKLSAQGLGDLGSDTTVLLAFKSNERLSRDKYQRAANQPYPFDVRSVLEGGAEDEAAHYAWVQETLEQLGAGERTAAGRAGYVFESGHTRLAGAMEAGEKRARQGTEAIREKLTSGLGGAAHKVSGVTTELRAGGMRTIWIALGLGLLAAQLRGHSSSTRPTSPSKGRRGPRKPTQSPQAARVPVARPLEARDVGLPAL